MTIDTGAARPGNSLVNMLTRSHDVLVALAKVSTLIGAACGFMYLFSYTVEVGIPFPLELEVLATTLLIIGLTSLVWTLFVIAGMFIPALTADEADLTNGYFKAVDRDRNAWLYRLRRYFFCTWIPMAFTLLGLILMTELIETKLFAKAMGVVAIAVAFGWIAFTPRMVGTFLDKRLGYILTMTMQIGISVGAYLLTILVLVVMLPEINHVPAWQGCAIALAFFTVIHAASSVPISDPRSLDASAGGRVTFPVIWSAGAIVLLLTAVSALLPGVNSKIGGAVLRVFHAGGGTPIVICLKEKPDEEIAKRFGFGDGLCSKKLLLLLDAGDKFYVSPIAGKNKADKTLLPEGMEPVSFSQEEVAQKIYFNPKPQRSAN